jgi:hypothetical protein
MVTSFEGAVLKTRDGSVVAEGFDGYRSMDGTGWLRVTGMPEGFPKLRASSRYILEANGETVLIFTREVNPTLMVTTHHLSVEHGVVRFLFLCGLVKPARLRMLPNVLAAGQTTSGCSISSLALSLRAPQDGCLALSTRMVFSIGSSVA